MKEIKKERKTKETDISVFLSKDSNRASSISSGVNFLDHMLDSFSKHAQISLDLSCKGDTHIDDHHSVEDIGIVLGEAFNALIYPVKQMERFGSASIVMDEALVSCDLDLSNRPFMVCELPLVGKVGTFDVELAEEFFKSFIFASRISAHIVMHRGENKHHIIEAAFKALAVALRRAMQYNEQYQTPSTKGVLGQ